jgi:hypothetical protein
VGNHGCLTHRQNHGTRQLPLWRVVVSSRCLRLVPAPPWEHLPPLIHWLVLGSLVWSAEGLPSTRTWPFRLPVAPATNRPSPGDAQGNVSRQLAGAVVWGGGAVELHQRRHSRAAGASALLQLALLRFFNSSA